VKRTRRPPLVGALCSTRETCPRRRPSICNRRSRSLRTLSREGTEFFRLNAPSQATQNTIQSSHTRYLSNTFKPSCNTIPDIPCEWCGQPVTRLLGAVCGMEFSGYFALPSAKQKHRVGTSIRTGYLYQRLRRIGCPAGYPSSWHPRSYL